MKRILLSLLGFLLIISPLSAQTRKRIAVIGGWTSGVAAAMFLSKSPFEVDIYEARDKFGGNARSLRVRPPNKNYDVTIDFGPLVFVSEWELYLQVLKHFGIYKNDFNYFNASIAVWKEGSYDKPTFVTPDLSTSYLEFVATNKTAVTDLIKILTTLQSAYIDFKNNRVAEDLSVGDWFKTVSTNQRLVQEVMLPIFTSFHTVPPNRISEFSILPIMKTTTFRSPISLKPLYTSKSGLGTYVNLIMSEVTKAHKNVHAHLSSPVTDIRRTPDGRWAVLSNNNLEYFDYVIMANQPINAKEILKGDEFNSINKILNELNYHKTRVVLHTDQNFALKKLPRFLNIMTRKDGTLATTFRFSMTNPKFGDLLTTSGLNDAEYQMLKNKNAIIAEENFYHPLYTTSFVKSAKVLRKEANKLGNIQFAGAWTSATDETQETAIIAAYGAILDILKKENEKDLGFLNYWKNELPKLNQFFPY